MLIGHSGHAFITLEYAKKYPIGVSHLVLMCSAPLFRRRQAARRVYLGTRFARRKAAWPPPGSAAEAIAAAPEQRLYHFCANGPKAVRLTYDAGVVGGSK